MIIPGTSIKVIIIPSKNAKNGKEKYRVILTIHNGSTWIDCHQIMYFKHFTFLTKTLSFNRIIHRIANRKCEFLCNI